MKFKNSCYNFLTINFIDTTIAIYQSHSSGVVIHHFALLLQNMTYSIITSFLFPSIPNFLWWKTSSKQLFFESIFYSSLRTPGIHRVICTNVCVNRFAEPNGAPASFGTAKIVWRRRYQLQRSTLDASLPSIFWPACGRPRRYRLRQCGQKIISIPNLYRFFERQVKFCRLWATSFPLGTKYETPRGWYYPISSIFLVGICLCQRMWKIESQKLQHAQKWCRWNYNHNCADNKIWCCPLSLSKPATQAQSCLRPCNATARFEW